MRSIKPTTIRLDDEDIRLVEIIKKKYGQSSLIGVLRTALRIAAEVKAEQTIHKSITERPDSGSFGQSVDAHSASGSQRTGAGEEI